MTSDADTRNRAEAWWSTSISDIEPGSIRLRGYDIADLIGAASFPDVIWLLLRGDLPAPAQSRLLEAALVAAVDHGPQAPSIAAARMAATCGVGINNAVATGVNMLGDVHGGAGQECMALLEALVTQAGDGDDLVVAVRQTIDEHRTSGRYIPGFGHRFHPVDPRRDPLLALLEEARDDGVVRGSHLAAALELERALAAGRRTVPMNIDGVTAAIYCELGFEPAVGRGLFVLSRTVGILAHAWEETTCRARLKGPMPSDLLPAYTGRPPRSFTAATDEP